MLYYYQNYKVIASCFPSVDANSMVSKPSDELPVSDVSVGLVGLDVLADVI